MINQKDTGVTAAILCETPFRVRKTLFYITLYFTLGGRQHFSGLSTARKKLYYNKRNIYLIYQLFDIITWAI